MPPGIKKIPILLTIAVVCGSCATGKILSLVNSGEVPGHAVIEKDIACEKKGGLLFVKIGLNDSDKEFTFLLDTGAFTVINEKIAGAHDLEAMAHVKAKDSSGRIKRVGLVKIDTLTIGGIEIKNCAASIIPLERFKKEYGLQMDGVLGSNVLKLFKVTLDYENKRVSLSTDVDSPVDDKNSYPVKMKKELTHGFAPLVKIIVNDRYEADGILDTGYNGIIIMPGSIVKRVGIDENRMIKTIGSAGGGSFGGFENGRLFRIETLAIGDLEFKWIPAFSHKGQTNYMLIGNGALSHFEKVIINYPKDELTIIPRAGNPAVTNVYSFGLSLAKNEQGSVIVSGIYEHSPADESDIELEDEIVKLNSHDIDEYSIPDLYDLFNDSEVHTVDLSVRGKNGTRRITLKKDMLLPKRQ